MKSKVLSWLPAVPLAIYAIVILFFVWTRLNYTQMDFAGHLASGEGFARGLFHGHNDTFFLGGVQNLFYPPLEDALVALCSVLSGGGVPLGYKIYLSAVIVGYLFSFKLLLDRLESQPARWFTLVIFLAASSIAKPGLTQYQGLGTVDLIVTGLSSEHLGAIFLFLLLREMLGRARILPIALLTLLITLSHLVIFAVALLVGGLMVLTSDRRRALLGGLLGLGLASFFLVPFFSYGSFIVKGSIDLTEPIGFFVVALVGSLVAFRHEHSRTIFVSALVLTFLVLHRTTFKSTLGGLPFPKFHYYRFAIIAVILLALGAGLLIDQATRGVRTRLLAGLVAGGLGISMLVHMKLYEFEGEKEFTQTKINKSKDLSLTSSKYGRLFVIEHDRASGFGIGSALTLDHPGLKTAKGLYWESSPTNDVLNSYMATLLRPPVVLAYFYYFGYDCPTRKCMFDHFTKDANVTHVALGRGWAPKYLKPLERQCFREIKTGRETQWQTLEPSGSFSVSGQGFDVFELRKKRNAPEAFSTDVIEFVHPNWLTAVAEEIPLRKQFIQHVYRKCKAGDVAMEVFLPSREVDRIDRALPSNTATVAAGPLTFTRDAPGRYAVEVPGTVPTLFRIKLAYLPGWTLRDATGRELPLFDATPHVLGLGMGKMTLTLERTSSMYIGYFASLVVLVVILVGRKKAWWVSVNDRA